MSESIAAIRMKESTNPYIVQELTNLLIEKRKKSETRIEGKYCKDTKTKRVNAAHREEERSAKSH